MKRFFTLSISCLLILIRPAYAQRIIGDSLDISLLTCSPGNELYSAFGHSAIRVQDRLNEVDVVFNYGTFDFEQEGFYINFVRGKLMYFLDLDAYTSFYNQYLAEGREIRELGLLLTATEKENILKFLLWNSRRENKFYAYDFFWDNCSTRVRDVFSNELKNKLKWHTEGWDSSHTLRENLKPYVQHLPWVSFGFDLILGLPCEQLASPMDQTFLPDRLEKLVRTASIEEAGLKTSWVTRDIILLKKNIVPETTSIFSPLFTTTALLFFLSLLTLLEWQRKITFALLSHGIIGISGVLGVFFVLMGFTDHFSTPYNLNILWLLPSNLMFVFLPNHLKWKKHYLLGCILLTSAILISFPVFPQQMNLAFIPLMLMLINRYVMTYKNLSREIH